MTWKAMTPSEAADVADFWIGAPWPMTLVATNRYAAALGWTFEVDEGEEYLEDSVSGLSMPDVDTSVMPSGDLASLVFRTTDVIRESSTELEEFLNDQFTLLVREGTSRWGTPQLETTRVDRQAARWEPASGSRIEVHRSSFCVRVQLLTPQYARVLRDLGE